MHKNAKVPKGFNRKRGKNDSPVRSLLARLMIVIGLPLLTNIASDAVYDFCKSKAEHGIMQVVEDDLHVWWAHVQTLKLPRWLARPQKLPQTQSWEWRAVQMLDQTDALWRQAQRRAQAPLD